MPLFVLEHPPVFSFVDSSGLAMFFPMVGYSLRECYVVKIYTSSVTTLDLGLGMSVNQVQLERNYTIMIQ